jgi:hypothetical protein
MMALPKCKKERPALYPHVYFQYRCQICKDFESGMNAVIGEMRVKNRSSAARIRGDIFTGGPKTTRRY